MKGFKYLIFILFLFVTTVWIGVFKYLPKNLKVIACEVGQGAAILITFGKLQILNDGGPNNRILDCLNKYMPFWDKEIEAVILSHPQKDH